MSSFLSRKRRQTSDTDEFEFDDNFFGEDFEQMFHDLDPSVKYYPEPYCSILQGY